MLERHKLLMGRTQDRAGQNNGSIGVFWRSFNGIIGHIRYMFRGPKITHNHEQGGSNNLGEHVGHLPFFHCPLGYQLGQVRFPPSSHDHSVPEVMWFHGGYRAQLVLHAC